ncbi:hypothetical protein [Ferrovum sp.]|uniref:hypothetical protein n=1 Tax=Ferrovum sp. TaxID=2609467 RepID=UPI002623F51A|nr:hypothetical protein [Ferrovum sp.]
MSRVYMLSDHSSIIIDELKDGQIAGLTHFYQPVSGDGKPNPWPDAVTDGASYGWFENDMILFWGNSNDKAILAKLRAKGIRAKLIN